MEKNSLQEIFQKEKRPLPEYETFSCGEPYGLQWRSKVTVINRDGCSESVHGEFCKSKTEAERSAAKKMISILNAKDKIIDDKIIKPSKKHKIIILIDAENLPNMIEEAKKVENATVLAFVGKYHHSAEKDWGVETIVVNTTRKDGVDCYIQMFMGKMIIANEKRYYIIVTRDHFGHTLAEIVNNESKKHKCVVVTTKSQLEEVL
jgi:hypothetical protein